ncbi:MAG: hypothetical protein OHK0038_22130 [Flammeovirgaceae bacterium]
MLTIYKEKNFFQINCILNNYFLILGIILTYVNYMEDNNNIIEAGEKPKKTPKLPSSQFNFLGVAQAVSATWNTRPEMTLIWTNAADFATLVNKLGIVLQQRINAGNQRKPNTQELKKLDDDLNKAIEALKVALQYKFGKKEATAYFGQFGIVKERSGYRFPYDRNERVNRFPLLISSLETYQIKVQGYNNGFFTNLYNQYKTLLTNTVNTDSTVASTVNEITDLRQKITNVINALIHLIKANYPNSFEAEMRAWGLHKEKY